MHYQYTPLNIAEAQTRLLLLHPGSFNEELCCTLQIVSLNNFPTYEALSYVWGDPRDTLPIVVEGTLFQATINLEGALRHLRLENKPRILWVDAICINQGDSSEKGAQIPQMGKIYQQATSVLAWFGYGDEDIRLATIWMDADFWAQPGMEKQARESSTAMLEQYRTFMAARYGLYKLLAHPYWTRMWTFQEFILNEKPPICCYGFSNFPCSSIADADMKYLGVDKVPEFITDEAREPASDDMLKLFNSRTARDALQIHTLIDQYGTAKEKLREKKSSLAHLLLSSGGRSMTDPRDRVYALLGLLPEMSNKPTPDMSTTYIELFRQTCIHILRSDHDIWPWICFKLFPDRLTALGQPSWVLDLTSFEVSGQNFVVTDSLTVRAPSVWNQEYLSSDMSMMSFWAWNLGTCTALFRVEPECKEINSKLVTFLDDLEYSKQFDHCKEFIRIFEALGETRFVKAIVAALDAVKNVRSREERRHQLSQHISDFRVREMLEAQGKTIIKTSLGFVGLAPFDITDGDIALYSPMMTRPTIVRRTKRDPGNHILYLMVGSADFHGICAWEHLRQDLVQKVIDQGFTRYHIV